MKIFALYNIKEHQVKIKINATTEELMTHERIELTQILQFSGIEAHSY